MIKINLLGKKKAVGSLPFGLDEHIEKLGINGEDLAELRPALIRALILIVGLYVGNFVPNYFHQKKIEELDAQIAKLNEKKGSLKRELVAKQDVRNQMEKLRKEEEELQRRLRAVTSIQKNRDLAFRTVDHVVVSMPAKVWMKKFQYDDKKVTINAASWEYFPITDFVRAVNESTRYSSVLFKDVKAETSSEGLAPGVPAAAQRVKAFELSFTAKGSEDT